MMRLVKKCFFLSVGLHLLVLAGLILWAAFMIVNPEKMPPQLSMIAPEILDNILNPQPTPAPAPAPAPVVTPVRRINPTPPQPVKPQIKPTPPRPVKIKPTPRPKNPIKATKPPRKKHVIEIAKNTQTSTGTTSRLKKTQPKVAKPAVSTSQLNNIRKMRNQLSAAIKVNVSGANRAAFTSYANHVVAVYRRTWEPLIPANLARPRVAEVSVTIRRDGRVLSARIIRRTGDAALDLSVQRALDRVRTIGKSFPSGSRDPQRTFTLDFTPQIRGGN
jgi:protein TonB